jgi:hypothetical protein
MVMILGASSLSEREPIQMVVPLLLVTRLGKLSCWMVPLAMKAKLWKASVWSNGAL